MLLFSIASTFARVFLLFSVFVCTGNEINSQLIRQLVNELSMRVSKPSPSGDDQVLHNQIMLMMFTSLQKDVFSVGIPPHKLNSEHLLLLEQFNSIIRGFHEPNSDVHAQHLGVVYDGIVQNQALSAFGDCKVTCLFLFFCFFLT
jgi:hypothetical protein